MLLLVWCIGGFVDMVFDCFFENFVDGVVSGFVFEDSNVWLLLWVIWCVFVLWFCFLLWWFV